MSSPGIIELIEIYKKYNNNPLKFDKSEISRVMKLIVEIKYFKDIQSRIGYINLKELCLNMKIIFYPKGTKVNKVNDIRTTFLYLILGKTKTMKQSSKKVTRFQIHEMQCLTDSYFAEFDSIKYIQITQGSIVEKFKRFSNVILQFPPFIKISQNEIEKLYLYYDSLSYQKGEYVYKENDQRNGIYLILNGEFLFTKQRIRMTSENKLNQLNREIYNLKKESSFYMFCLGHKLSLSHFRNYPSDLPCNNNIKKHTNLMIEHKGNTYNVRI